VVDVFGMTMPVLELVLRGTKVRPAPGPAANGGPAQRASTGAAAAGTCLARPGCMDSLEST
jgi:hypothetical protein